METIFSIIFWILLTLMALALILVIGGLLVQGAEKIFGKDFWEKNNY